MNSVKKPFEVHQENGSDDCFIAMDFSQQFSPVYEEILYPAICDAGLHPVRSDNLVSSAGVISEQILELIQKARLVIADITGANPNVMIEVGLALALKKNLILISQDTTFPSDLRAHRINPYDMSEEGKRRLYTELTDLLKSTVYPSQLYLRNMLYHYPHNITYVLHGRASKEHISSVSPQVDKSYLQRLNKSSSATSGIVKLAVAYHKVSWASATNQAAIVPSMTDSAPENILEEGNAFILGGPGANNLFNRVTEALESHYKNALNFNFKDQPNDKKQYYIVQGKEAVSLDWDSVNGEPVDYAILMRAPSPFRPQATLWLAAGLRSFGTEAAINVLVTPSLIQALQVEQQDMGNPDQGIWAIIKTSYCKTNNTVGNPKIYRSGILELR